MFIEIERCLGTSFEQLLLELMVKTGKEEKQITKQSNNYHEGVPAITVVVDGGWSKQSHKHSYNANSGFDVIFGNCCTLGSETNTVLFVLLHKT